MNKREAKAKIRNHLKTKGNNWCCSSEPLASWWWNVINKAVFDEILPHPIRFEFRNFHGGTLGMCVNFGRNTSGDVVIWMRREYDERNTFLAVLVHEMVHQYQWYTEKRMHHGKTFYAWKQRVKTVTGLPLNEYIYDI